MTRTLQRIEDMCHPISVLKAIVLKLKPTFVCYEYENGIPCETPFKSGSINVLFVLNIFEIDFCLQLLIVLDISMVYRRCSSKNRYINLLTFRLKKKKFYYSMRNQQISHSLCLFINMRRSYCHSQSNQFDIRSCSTCIKPSSFD